MHRVAEEQVEQLLRAEYRAQLPFGRLLALYLDPFALFKDASRGSTAVRAAARRYNRALRWVLLAYLQRWLLIALALFVATLPAERYTPLLPLLKIPAAACAVGACLALAVLLWTVIAYLLLAAPAADS